MISQLQKKLRNKFKDGSVSILASGPSLELFIDDEHKLRVERPVIGVNGSSALLKEGDIFISGEEGTHLEPWFYSCPKGVINVVRACSALYTERFYPDEKERCELVNRFQKFLAKNISHVRTRWDGIREIIPEELQNPFDMLLPSPADPHMLLHHIKNMDRYTKIDSQQKYLIIGGTVTSLATQIAYHLGAKEIHLYGASFTNESSMGNSPGKNYFKLLKLSGGGYTTPFQRETFDEVINQIQQNGTKIFSHGFSRLKNTIKLDK